MTENPFADGTYFTRFRDGAYSPTRDHKIALLNEYAYSLRLIDRQNWRSPFSLPEPRVAQIGSAIPDTAEAFIEFVNGRNPNAHIYILDRYPYSLRESIGLRIQDRANHVQFVQGDALALPFKNDSLDLIETDALLQFFSDSDKATVIKEWFRTLAPGGVVTTRDWMLPGNANASQIQEEHDRRRDMQETLGVLPYITTRGYVARLFAEAGFVLKMARSRDHNNLYSIVAQKPPIITTSM